MNVITVWLVRLCWPLMGLGILSLIVTLSLAGGDDVNGWLYLTIPVAGGSIAFGLLGFMVAPAAFSQWGNWLAITVIIWGLYALARRESHVIARFLPVIGCILIAATTMSFISWLTG